MNEEEKQDQDSGIDRVVEKTPWWAISVGSHALFFVIMGWFVILTRPAETEEPVTVHKRKPQPPPPEFIKKDREIKPMPIPIPKTTDEPVVVKRPNDERLEDDTEDEWTKAIGDSEKFNSKSPFKTKLSSDVIGNTGGGGGNKGGDIGGKKWRRPGPTGGKPETKTQAAVLRALIWLARHQSKEGAWRAAAYSANCNGKRCTPDHFEGSADYDIGVTGLALLAFLGAGYTHMTEERIQGIAFGEVVRKGIRWLIRSQDPNGCVGGRNVFRHMYNHSIATLALCELYWMTKSPLIREPAQRAVDFLVDARNPKRGWRYVRQPGDNDTSVVGWAVMALKSAEMANLSFPESAYRGATAWLDSVTEETYYRVGYDRKGTGKVSEPHNRDFEHHESMTAVGMMCRMFMDRRTEDRRVRGGGQLLIRDLPKWEKWSIDFYYWYYGSLALFQYAGAGHASYWKKWNEALVKALLPNQNLTNCRSGSWNPVGRWCSGGRVYATAINALTLEVYYRYPNVFGIRR